MRHVWIYSKGTQSAAIVETTDGGYSLMSMDGQYYGRDVHDVARTAYNVFVALSPDEPAISTDLKDWTLYVEAAGETS